MGRFVAPDRGVKETVIGGKKYNPDKGGIYSYEREVPPEAERENPGEHDSKGNDPSRHNPQTAVGF